MIAISIFLVLSACNNYDAENTIQKEETINDELIKNVIDKFQCDQLDAQEIVNTIIKYIPDNIDQITVTKDSRVITINNRYNVQVNKKNHIYAIFDIENEKYLYAEYE